MTASENTLDSLKAAAERLGKEQEEIDKRNRKRRAKGRKPLPDAQEKKDMEIGRKRYRTGDPTTVEGADALKLFELRKAEMEGTAEDDLDIDDEEDDATAPAPAPVKTASAPPQSPDAEKAVATAAAARRVQDMKNGRIDHEGNWSESGQNLDGGDNTEMPTAEAVKAIWENEGGDRPTPLNDLVYKPENHPQPPMDMKTMFSDLYRRLGTSFDAIERTLSDLQGRVSEIVTATTPSEPQPIPEDAIKEDVESEFKALLKRKTPITFDVGGTRMTFDAISVFSTPPCITVVSKIESAKITPIPGARLKMSYEMEGVSYENDPVTFLGTRFDLPMFGLSFVGFIRDREADTMDAAAGIPEQKA